MTEQSPWNEERLAELLALLTPPPTGWIEAAAQLPALRATLDGLVARAEQDAEFRTALIADLEAAVAREGFQPTRLALDELRSRLQTD
jgi:hypothetical protein